jgi:cysteinyl-tRNA synthetase
MRLYNTLTRREEEFAPSRGNQVRMYTCGLTVYARGHIGNFRTFVALDVLRRALRHQEGYEMRHVMNFTDVDDRTILESQKAGRAAARVHRPLHRGVPRGCRRPRPRAGRGDAAGDRRRERGGDGGDDPGARGQRPHVPERRVDLLQDLDAARLRQARAARPRRHEERRADRFRQVRQGGRARLRAVEGDRSRASRRGTRGSGRAGPAGTSSARRWRSGCSASRRSTSTPAAST